MQISLEGNQKIRTDVVLDHTTIWRVPYVSSFSDPFEDTPFFEGLALWTHVLF